MMKLRRVFRVIGWTVGILLLTALGLYLLRWPLLGGFVRSKLSRFAAEKLEADVEVGRLGGSLLFSAEAADVTLRSRSGVPFRAVALRRATVEYGFLGSGEPTVDIEGARIQLARQEGPATPVHGIARDVVTVLRSLRIAASVSARNIEIIFPDGRVVSVERGALDHAAWSVTLRTQGFGEIEASGTLGSDGELAFDGRATDGPVRSASLRMGKGDERCPLNVTAVVEGRSLEWAGTATLDKGALTRIEGELKVKEGLAETRIDLVTGRLEADVDAIVPVDEEFRGDLKVSLRAEGSLERPWKEWSLRDGSVKTKGARFRKFTIDEAAVTLGAGTLERIPFQARARSGQDTVDGEGIFRWTGEPDVDVTLRATAADVAPYLALLPEPPRLRCLRPHAEGRFILREGQPSFDGSIVTGAGSFEDRGWEVVSFKGSLRKDRIEAQQLNVYGASFAPSIAASGKYEGETISFKFNAGADEGEIGGRLQKNGDFEGRIRLEGPLAWLRVFDITLPPELTPVRMAGKLRREKDETLVMVDLAAGHEITFAPVVTIRQKGDDVFAGVAAGTITLPKRRIEYGAFVLTLTSGKASLENLRLTCSDPEVSGRITGSATWDAKEVRGTFSVDELKIWDTPIEPLAAAVTVDRETRDVLPDLRWGKDEGDHLRIQGRWGREFDLQVVMRTGDLKRPLVRRFLPQVELDGFAALDAHLTGTPEQPGLSGTLRLDRISTPGLPPLSLVLPLRSEGDRLKIWSTAEGTPYGTVSLDATLPMPGAEPRLELTLRIATDDLTPLLDRLTPDVRPWIPRGALVAEASLRGPPAKLEWSGHAEFVALRWNPPAPLAEATDLRVSARLDADGVEIETADGFLGRGPFWASGRWDFWKPDQPLSLWITGWDLLVVDDLLTRIRVKPDAVLSWDRRRGLKLAGRVEVPIAVYNREFAAATPGRKETARRVVAPHLKLVPAEAGGFLIPGLEGLDALDLDLKFATTGEFRIENSVVGMLLDVTGHLTGPASEPALSAVVRSHPHRGEVKVGPGVFIRIESAEAVLPEEVGRASSVQFYGRMGTGEGMVQILVNGPLDGPSLILKSDPPRPQKELLSRLAFGLETGAVSSEAGVATFALYVLDQTREGWPNADRKESFWDKFRPSVIPGETAQQRHVPWELPPAGNLRSTSLRTEYVYNSYFSIVAETSSEGDVGGDLKLRIRF